MLAAMARKEFKHDLDKVDISIIDPGKCRTDAGGIAGRLVLSKS